MQLNYIAAKPCGGGDVLQHIEEIHLFLFNHMTKFKLILPVLI